MSSWYDPQMSKKDREELAASWSITGQSYALCIEEEAEDEEDECE